MNHKNRGSMTVEAAIVLPFVIFAVMAFLYLFRVLSMEVMLQQSLSEASDSTSQYAYVYLNGDIPESVRKKAEENEVLQKFSGSLLADVQVNSFFAEKENYQNILNGKITYQNSSILNDNETIDFVAEYKIKIPGPFFSIKPIAGIQRVRTRAFIGMETLLGESRETSEDTQEEYVYITEYGTVYHRNSECTHLYLTVQKCNYEDLNSKRNVSGGKYYPCEKCCKTKVTRGIVYITDNGACYHLEKQCSGLKRTIQKVPLSSVENMRPCSKCGNTE